MELTSSRLSPGRGVALSPIEYSHRKSLNKWEHYFPQDDKLHYITLTNFVGIFVMAVLLLKSSHVADCVFVVWLYATKIDHIKYQAFPFCEKMEAGPGQGRDIENKLKTWPGQGRERKNKLETWPG